MDLAVVPDDERTSKLLVEVISQYSSTGGGEWDFLLQDCSTRVEKHCPDMKIFLIFALCICNVRCADVLIRFNTARHVAKTKRYIQHLNDCYVAMICNLRLPGDPIPYSSASSSSSSSSSSSAAAPAVESILTTPLQFAAALRIHYISLF